MIPPQEFLSTLRGCGVSFFTGVPDSLLKEFLLVLQSDSQSHYIGANEGACIAMAVGNHLASGQLGLVYMQNSGLGNAVNPLMSLAHQTVYSIPLLLLIGWRGEPEVPDEPQHQPMGMATERFLDNMQIPFTIISANTDYVQTLRDTSRRSLEESRPIAILCRKGIFAKANVVASLAHQPAFARDRLGDISTECRPTAIEEGMPDNTRQFSHQIPISNMKREEALEIITAQLTGKEAIICTTGAASRELYEIRTKTNHSHQQDFLNVGAMGHCSLIALGVSLGINCMDPPNGNKDKGLTDQTIHGSTGRGRQVLCIDGDGSAIMHMGALTTIGRLGPTTFKHIILNNHVHDSVGGQPTGSDQINFLTIGKACGYRNVASCNDRSVLAAAVHALMNSAGPSLLEIVVQPGMRDSLARPPQNLREMKRQFMSFMSAETCDNVST